MAVTDHFDLPLPDETRNVDDEFRQLIITLQMIDVILKSIRDAALAAAPEGHGHQLGDIAGLVDALASKMPANAAFALDNLTDVSGAAAAPNGHVLAKLAGGWSPVSAAAAIGNHQHAMGDIAGLAAALAEKLGLTGGTLSGTLRLATVLFARATAAGGQARVDFERSDGTVSGRLWHVGGANNIVLDLHSADGATLLTRITLSGATPGTVTINDSVIVTAANFPSQLDQQFYAGAMLPFAMSSAPTGWLKCNGAAVSRTTYSRLFTAIGTTFGTGDGSTTFNLPDLRGEFVRGWDDGRGIDAGRAFGSLQLDAYQAHTHQAESGNLYLGGASGPVNAFYQSGVNILRFQDMGTGNGRTATETRPRNVALLWCIKW